MATKSAAVNYRPKNPQCVVLLNGILDKSSILGCIVKLVQLLDAYATSVKRLPPSLKDVIRAEATSTRHLSATTLPCLLHSNICELDLSRCDLNSQSLEVLRTCAGITKLDMSSFAGVTRNFDSLALASLFPSLQLLSVLSLNYIDNVTDEVVQAVVENCPAINTLYLQGCCQITDDALKALPNLRHLQFLNISHTKVTDTGMVELLDACGKCLRKLFIANCINLTRTTFLAIVRNWVSLERLVCDGCPFEDRQLHREIELREREARMNNMRRVAVTLEPETVVVSCLPQSY